MPKEEFDMEDPLELNGQVVPCNEDNDDAMAVAFMEEFLFLGYSSGRILELFANPDYIGPYRVFKNKGLRHVNQLLTTTLNDWTPES